MSVTEFSTLRLILLGACDIKLQEMSKSVTRKSASSFPLLRQLADNLEHISLGASTHPLVWYGMVSADNMTIEMPFMSQRSRRAS